MAGGRGGGGKGVLHGVGILHGLGVLYEAWSGPAGSHMSQHCCQGVPKHDCLFALCALQI